MTVLATVGVPAEEFILGDMIAVNAKIELELEPVVPLGTSRSPHLRMGGASESTFETALMADPDVSAFTIVEARDNGCIARIEWADRSVDLYDVIADSGGTIMAATCQGSTWRLRLRFPTHDALSTCYQRCVERGLQLTLDNLGSGGWEDQTDQNRLTPAQRETIQVALDRGYFEVPRRITLQALAEELSVSDTAVSQRLRRGLSTIVANQLRLTEGIHDDGRPIDLPVKR